MDADNNEGRYVGIHLNAESKIDWVRPQAAPSGFETISVNTGQQGASASPPIEIAIASWTKAGEPNRDAITKLHHLRKNQRVTPVILVVELAGGAAVLFGPNPEVAQTKALPEDQIERILQAVLDESTPVAARTRLASLLQSLDTTSIPGVKNSGLFANHELKAGVPQRGDWLQACDSSLPLLAQRDHALIEHLGYKLASAGAHALVLTGSGPRPEAIAVMLEGSETFDADSQRFSVSPVAYGLKMAEQAGVPWLILSRGSQLRLYPARIDLGVGRKGLAETFLEVDLPQLTRETAGYLSLIFSAPALAEGGSTFEIMQASMIYAVALGERLRDKVYEEIVPRLSVAVADQLVDRGYEMDASGLDLAYQLTLRIFFRMLFQTYAEDRKLLPFGENEKYDRNALKTVALDLVDNPEQPFDENSTSLWDDLAQVWHVIDKGDKAWGVPAYNGGLFAADPELNEHGAIIETLAISNDVIGPCLKALLLDEGDDGEFGPIDFRSLSVREFGTIYEGLLESSLGLAEMDLTLDDKATWVPAKKGDVVETKAGEVYFHNTSGQRKGTGSYYTPTFVVEHLLERSLDPALDDHLARVATLIEAGDQAGAAELFFDFRVADLAMGSGHFLTAAIDHIEKKMAAFLEEEGHQIPGVAKEIILLGNAARDAIGDPDGPLPEGSSLLRRQIARRCIYGLDINPISVELARVAIWIHTFVRGLPMSSLDHNLVCANSLTGIGSIDEALDVLVPGRNGAATLFDAPIEDALKAAQAVLADFALLPEVDRKETQAASRAVRSANAKAERARLLFDAAVLNRIGRGDLVDAVDPKTIANLASAAEAQGVLAPLAPGHMPVLFPEVFLRENGGFDAVFGNPPWDKVEADRQIFVTRHVPGFRSSGSQAEKDAASEKLLKNNASLAAGFDEEVERQGFLRNALVKGPYPGMGVDHPDLAKAFAWRNILLLRSGGISSLVLPRTVISGRALHAWRREVFAEGRAAEVLLLGNAGGWVFPEVHAQKEFVLVTTRMEDGRKSGLFMFGGPLRSRSEWNADRLLMREVNRRLLGELCEIPNLPSTAAASILSKCFDTPRFGDTALFMQSVYETDASKNKPDFAMTGAETGDLPVYKGESFNLWDPDTGVYYSHARESHIVQVLREKAASGRSRSNSAFYGFTLSDSDLPLFRPRIAYRWTTNSTNSRTMVVSLVPPSVVLTNGAPYLFNAGGKEHDEAFLLGVFSSIIFDWIARRYVEGTLRQGILNQLPVPSLEGGQLRLEVEQRAGRLAAKDDRFAGWAKAVGVPVGSVKSSDEQADMEAELDALVSRLYGLSRDQVEHVFATFHRGWDYAPRLASVLRHFDAI